MRQDGDEEGRKASIERKEKELKTLIDEENKKQQEAEEEDEDNDPEWCDSD